jgi:hypothetical protein
MAEEHLSVNELIEAELAKYEKEPNPNEVAAALLPQLSEGQTWEVSLDGLVDRVVRLMRPHRRRGGRWYKEPGPSRRAIALRNEREKERRAADLEEGGADDAEEGGA